MITEEQKELLGLTDERKDFYFKVENAVVDDGCFDNIYEFAVYIVLSRYCNGNGFAFPSIPKIAEKAYCSVASVKRALIGLEEKGYIKKVNRIKEGTKEKDTNLYAVQNIREYEDKGSKNREVGSDRTEGRFSQNGGVGSDRTEGRFSQSYNKEIIKKNNIKKNKEKGLEYVSEKNKKDKEEFLKTTEEREATLEEIKLAVEKNKELNLGYPIQEKNDFKNKMMARSILIKLNLWIA